jgi:hypothetical protein
MFNLEKLSLSLVIRNSNEFVDGNDLKKNIIDRLPRLNSFAFNIRSRKVFCNQINFLSNDDIQRTFSTFQNQIISCVDYFPETEYSQCHIYSYPYKLTYYTDITNNFPGGLFQYVNEVSLFDEQPFEHEFFLQIVQSFPFMKKLTVINQKPQNKRRCEQLNNHDQTVPIIQCPRITLLDLYRVHDDYIEQFLVDTNTCLPDTIYLIINYKSLERVTHNFTRNSTRINCAKLRSLGISVKHPIPGCVKDYFPYTDIC